MLFLLVVNILSVKDYILEFMKEFGMLDLEVMLGMQITQGQELLLLQIGH